MNLILNEFIGIINNKRFFSNRYSWLALLFLSNAFFCQTSPAQIDSLYNTTYELRKQGKYDEAIDLNLKLIEYSKSQKYSKGAAYSSFEVGNLYHNLGNYKQSLVYLDQSLSYNKEVKSAELYSKIYTELGKNYSMLSLLQNAINNYNIAEQWSLKISDKDKREKSLFYVYSCKAVSYEAIGDLKASNLAAESAFKIKQDVISATRLAKNYILFKNDLAKSKEFLDIANDLIQSDSSVTPYQRIAFLYAEGLYYNKNKEYKKSAESYLEAINLAKKLKRPNEEKELYKLLYQTYKDDAKDEKFLLDALEKYTVINDSMENENMKIIEEPMHKIINEKQKEYLQNYKLLLYIGIVILSVISFVAYRLFKRKNRKKKIILQKEKIILQKQYETHELKQRINESFSELVELAEKNSPQFWIRFQEVYPEYLNKMLTVNSKFTNAELTLSAYIYIGISSKDIASYTFRSLKTIENTRYSLRKKLGISSEENLNVWLRDYIDNH
ncbi:hypothetical protein [Chryseobacterium gambrini]|uniref:Tetratricopeptide repeat protein n=1 Tax=Chryseobacterium gambrini TaxID=373672 RepID=A0ABM8K8N1_9FLAO|nr:tetratricopeptide repeat protein [Chryseobacterium gambrini]